MRTKGRKLFQSLGARIALAFLLTMVLLLLGFLYVYSLGGQMIWTRGVSTLDAEQEYLLDTMERSLSNIYTYETEMAVSSEISFLINTYDTVGAYQRYRNMIDVMNRLSTMKRNNDWITSIRVHIPKLSRTLTDKMQYLPLYDECAYLEQLPSSFISFPTLNGSFCIVSRYPWLSGKPVFYIVAELAFNHLSTLLPPAFEGMLADMYVTDAGCNEVFGSVNGNMELLKLCSTDAGLQELTYKKGDYLARSDPFFMGQLRLVTVVSSDAFSNDLNMYRKIFLVFVALSLLLIVLFLLVINRYVSRPINNLVEDKYRQELLMKRAELKQLQSQVNPHFLHNSLLNIRAMAQIGDYDGITDMTDKLSQFYQYVTRSRDDVVLLQDEYRFVALYVAIQEIRFEGSIVCEMEPLPATLENAQIPRFILQTLVENAYKYGASTRPDVGHIRIRCTDASDAAMDIVVEDNGVSLDDDKLHVLHEMAEAQSFNGTGILNVAMRIGLYYRDGGSIKFERSGLGGLKVALHIFKTIDRGEDAHVQGHDIG
jgi:two-component system, sensor histidine kinase YesM